MKERKERGMLTVWVMVSVAVVKVVVSWIAGEGVAMKQPQALLTLATG